MYSISILLKDNTVFLEGVFNYYSALLIFILQQIADMESEEWQSFS